MRLASFNVENMFDRAKALNTETWAEGKPALEAHSQLNALFNKPVYTAADKRKMLELLEQQGMLKTDEGPLMLLRRLRGSLLRRPRNGPVTVAAASRSDWIGWVELKTEAVAEQATANTARVIDALGADVLSVVEAENRIVLQRFNEQLLPAVGAQPYAHVMLIDGNDERGIDVGLLTRSAYPIRSIRSHVDDVDAVGQIFSRDCAEYEIGLADGRSLWIMVNHFKSKGYGNQKANDAKRRRQALRVRELVDAHLAAGEDLVAVMGDFNDSPNRDPLQPLLGQGSPLRDVSAYGGFDDGGRPGTHGNCTAGSKIDYILLSPPLFAAIGSAGIERRGMWGGKNGTLWPRFPEVDRPEYAASDHAGIWVEINL